MSGPCQPSTVLYGASTVVAGGGGAAGSGAGGGAGSAGAGAAGSVGDPARAGAVGAEGSTSAGTVTTGAFASGVDGAAAAVSAPDPVAIAPSVAADSGPADAGPADAGPADRSTAVGGALRTEFPTMARDPDPAAAYPAHPVTASAAAHSRTARGVVGRTLHQTTGDPRSGVMARAFHAGCPDRAIDQLSVFTMLSAAISR